jgi:VanZ family protein
MSVSNVSVQDLRDDKTVVLLLCVYIVYVLVCALTPFTFSADSSSSLFELFADKFDTRSRVWTISTWDLISNILLFVPFGFLLVTVSVISPYPLTTKLLLAGAGALLLSCTVETAQLFLPRAPSVVDVLINTSGGLVGALLGVYARVPFCSWVQRFLLHAERSLWLVSFCVVYVVMLVVASALPLPIGPVFFNWDPDYPLQLGNEVTLDRPWLGKIFLLAIYDRALSPDEVLANFLEGSSSDGQQNRSNEGVVAFYDFREGAGAIIHDRSGLNQPIDLQIQNTRHVKWLRPNGLEILKSTRIESARVPSKLYTSKMLSDSELTVEVWIASSNLKQYGPARIVTLSRDTGLRNFSLGQTSQDVEFRLRTAVSGLNGMTPKLRTTDRPLTTATQHLVITYRLGAETLHVSVSVQKHCMWMDKSI